MTLESLFKKRQAAYMKSIIKYGRIIVNDHFVLILFILFGAGGFAYSNYLETLTLGMAQPRILVAFLYFVVVSTGSLTMLLEPADKVFLLPKEQEFREIFRKMVTRSYLQSLLIVALTTFITMPIFAVTINASTTDMLFVFLALAGLKWLTFLAKVRPFFETDTKTIQKEQLLGLAFRLLAIIGLTFLDIRITTAVILGLAGYTAYQFITDRLFAGQFFQWETMIQAEEKRMQRLYRFIGMFANVPNIETNIKRLSWLDGTLNWLSQKNPTAPYYYILRTVARNTDYSMLVVRATIVGCILLAVTGSYIISALLVLLFLYMIGFQLITLVQEIERTPQFRMYPVTAQEKAEAVYRLIFQILILVGILLALASINSLGIIGLSLMLIGFLFAYLFSYFYAAKRLKKIY